MTSSANPDAAPGREDKGDARSRLFALQVDLFVNAPARDRESLRAFEMLALGFMPRLDPAALAAAAERLAPCADTPPAVLEYLVRHSARARAAILRFAPALRSDVADRLIGLGRAAALAARPRLDASLQERLAIMEEPAVDEALAGNAATLLSEPVRRRLVERAADRPLLARALLARTDLSAADEMALYLRADRARRTAIRARIEASPTTEQPALPPLTEAAAATLVRLAETGGLTAFAEELSALLGLPRDTPWRFLRRDRQELLGLALAAAGADEAAVAKIAESLHPAISRSRRAVAALSEASRMKRFTALTLVEAILGRSAARGLAPVGESARRPVLPPAAGRPVPAMTEPQRLAG